MTEAKDVYTLHREKTYSTLYSTVRVYIVSTAIFRFHIILLKAFRFDFSTAYEMFFNGFT